MAVHTRRTGHPDTQRRTPNDSQRSAQTLTFDIKSPLRSLTPDLHGTHEKTMPSILRKCHQRVREPPIVLPQDENHCKSQAPQSYRLNLECLNLLELEEDYVKHPPFRNPLEMYRTNGDQDTIDSLGGSTKKKRSVQFQSLYIRTYNQVLGDHPCCSSGLPISLGWTCIDEEQVSINDYEICRNPRRNRCELRLDDFVRRSIILRNDFRESPCSSSDEECNANSSYSLMDLRKAERRAYRQRERMSGRKRNSRMASQFFNCPSSNAPVIGAE